MVFKLALLISRGENELYFLFWSKFLKELLPSTYSNTPVWFDLSVSRNRSSIT